MVDLDKISELLDANGRFTLKQGSAPSEQYAIALKAVEDGYLTFVSIPGMASFAITEKLKAELQQEHLEIRR